MLIDGAIVLAAGLCDLSAVPDVDGYIELETSGGASQMVLRPTTWAIAQKGQYASKLAREKLFTIAIKEWILSDSISVSTRCLISGRLTVWAGEMVPLGPSHTLITS